MLFLGNVEKIKTMQGLFVKLFDVIETLVEERGLEKSVLEEIVKEGVLLAYQKKYPELPLRIVFSDEKETFVPEIEKTVVVTVEDEVSEISARKARGYEKNAEAGDKIWLPFEGNIGRVEILKARQIIAQRIKDVECAAIHDEFKSREGEILQGVIHKIERVGVVVKIHDFLAFLPRTFSVPGEKLIVGYPVRALLKEVLLQPRNEHQLVLDRVSPEFLQKLFELEVPEIFEGLVEIKKIARKAGYKSKIIVVSKDSNIDPVGTCVGVAGARIKPILKELGTEKIDVIAYTDSLEQLVQHSLKPAEINKIEISDDRHKALVWLDDDQRSVAIGKMGQNIALAAELTGCAIELVGYDSRSDIEQKFEEEME